MKKQQIIEAYKAKASEHPELMDIFSRLAPLEHVVKDNEVIEKCDGGNPIEGGVTKVEYLDLEESLKREQADKDNGVKTYPIDLQPKTKEIDWSKPLQKVESKNQIVLTSGKHKQDTFSGMTIEQKDKKNGYEIGTYSSSLQKELFKLCEDQTINF